MQTWLKQREVIFICLRAKISDSEWRDLNTETWFFCEAALKLYVEYAIELSWIESSWIAKWVANIFFLLCEFSWVLDHSSLIEPIDIMKIQGEMQKQERGPDEFISN